MSNSVRAAALELAAELKRARIMVACGNFPQASMHLHRYVRFGGSDPVVAAVRRAIRAGFGIPDDFELSERRRAELGRARYLLIKAWGAGFWSDIHHVVGQLLLAELTHREPVVWWGRRSRFGDGTGTNAFEHFFVPVSGAILPRDLAGFSIFPSWWNARNILDDRTGAVGELGTPLGAPSFFTREEDILVSDHFAGVDSIIPWIDRSSAYYGKSAGEIYGMLFKKYLVPVSAIRDKANAFRTKYLVGRTWVAVHVRGSDKIQESRNLDRTNAGYSAHLDPLLSSNPDLGILLLTDSVPIHRAFSERYGAKMVSTPAIRTDSAQGIHFAKGHDGRTLGEQVLIDVILAMHCDYFVGTTESNVSWAIASWKEWPQERVTMLGTFDCRVDNLALHLTPTPPADGCRVCGGGLVPAFLGKVLSKYDIQYLRCGACGSLQTEMPYWLDEAYTNGRVDSDSGKASRCMLNAMVFPSLMRILGVRKTDRAVDVGGGSGLFARLMRDMGYAYFSYDKYGSGEFAGGATWRQLGHRCRIVSMFEVAEHFVEPMREWAKVFECDPDFVVGSTELYAGQGPEWAYLACDTGQHVFFYSSQAIAYIAARFQRYAYDLGGYFLLTREQLPEQLRGAVVAWRKNSPGACEEAMREWLRRPFAAAGRDRDWQIGLVRLGAVRGRILLDGIFFRFSSGIARIWRSLLAEWAADGLGEFLTVIDHDRTAPRYPGITYVDVTSVQRPFWENDAHQLQAICDRVGASLFISTYYSFPVSTPSVLLVVDMIPEVLGFDLAESQWQQKQRAIGYASSYLSISESTTRDLRRLHPHIASEDVVTSYCGTDFRVAPEGRVRAFNAQRGIDRPYFLLVGGRGDYKNAKLFFDAFARYGDERKHWAIICTNGGKELEPEFAECAGDAKVHLLRLSDDELQCAYTGATALVYPSRYEGFGLPVLEAMACACPVVTCATGSISEVGGEAVIYVPPDGVDEMHEALGAVQVEATRRSLVARGLAQAERFSWQTMAREVGDVLIAKASRAKAVLHGVQRRSDP